MSKADPEHVEGNSSQAARGGKEELLPLTGEVGWG
jgi:hypothetical protein